jgi:archaellum component FlaC
MKQKRVLSVRGPVTRVLLTVAIAALSLGIAGCGEQMARIDQNQLKLQKMVEANARQVSALAKRLEQDRQQLRLAIENVQDEVAKVAVEVSAVADTQIRLHEAVQANSLQLTGEIAAIGQDQRDLRASVAGVQSETRKVAAGLKVIAAEQEKLYVTVQENNVQLNSKVAVIERTQQERQDTIGGMKDNIQAVAASINALGEDVLRLQEMLQSNIRELVSIADITGKKQVEFRESMRKDLRTLDESVASLKQSQSNLQNRIEELQKNTPDYSDVPAALDQLRDQLEALRREQLSADEADAIEYEAAKELSTEEDSIE